MIVAHRCTTTNLLPKDFQDADIGSDRSYRTHANITVDVDGMAYFREGLELCGLDPSNITRKMMDDLNPISNVAAASIRIWSSLSKP